MKKNILVLEDDESISFLLREVISELGFHVEVCESKEAFIGKFLELEVNLILMDITIHGETVEDFVTQIKQSPKTADIPVVLLSGVNHLEAIVERTGADASFSKPFDINELEQYIQKTLE